MTDSIQRPEPQSKAAARFLAQLEEHNPATAQRIAELVANGPTKREPPPPTTRRSKTPPSKRAAPAQHARTLRATKAHRLERRRKREQQRDDRILDKVTAKIRDAGGTIARNDIVRIRSDVWTATAQIIADATGRAARIYIARLPSRATAGAILKAALENGQAWVDLRARRIAALGVALEMLSKNTRRSGPWRRVVIGITQPAFAALLRNPLDTRTRSTPSTNACFGEHRSGATEDEDSNQIGYYRALRRHGAGYSQQPQAHQGLSPSERGFPSGHAPSRYWLPAEAHEQAEDVHRERLAALHISANADADDLTHQDAERRQRQRQRETEPPPPD